MEQPEVLAVFSVAGFSFSGAAPNQGLMFARLKPFEERRGAGAVAARRCSARLRGSCSAASPARSSFRSRRRRFRVCQRSAGSQFEVLDGSGGDISNLAERDRTRSWARATSRARWRACSAASRPTIRSSSSKIDRDRARSLGLPIREVTDALSVLLGSQYVNDFDFNNRAYRVYVQADQQFRARADEPAPVLRAGAERADGAARHGRAA